MNEVIVVAHAGDNFNDLVKTAMEIVKINSVSYALFEFNGCKVFVKKDSTEETVMEEYTNKLQTA